MEKANFRNLKKTLVVLHQTEKAIKDGYLNNFKDGRAYDNLYIKGKAQCKELEADWLVGLNATRASQVRSMHRLSAGTCAKLQPLI